MESNFNGKNNIMRPKVSYVAYTIETNLPITINQFEIYLGMCSNEI